MIRRLHKYIIKQNFINVRNDNIMRKIIDIAYTDNLVIFYYADKKIGLFDVNELRETYAHKYTHKLNLIIAFEKWINSISQEQIYE